MSAKEAILDLIRQMPDDVSTSDVMEELFVRQKIELGLEQIERGEGVPHEKAKLELQRWLK